MTSRLRQGARANLTSEEVTALDDAIRLYMISDDQEEPTLVALRIREIVVEIDSDTPLIRAVPSVRGNAAQCVSAGLASSSSPLSTQQLSELLISPCAVGRAIARRPVVASSAGTEVNATARTVAAGAHVVQR